jgi:hypothetical protein
LACHIGLALSQHVMALPTALIYAGGCWDGMALKRQCQPAVGIGVYMQETLSIFKEQLELWGTPGETGIIALVQAVDSYGLAVYFETGWLHCSAQNNRVVWSPTVKYEARYCHGKSN